MKHQILLGGMIVLSCTVGFAPRALGTVTLESQDRLVSTFAFLDTGMPSGAQRTDELLTSEEPGPFAENAVCHLEDAEETITAAADQTSMVSAESIAATFGGSVHGVVPQFSHVAEGISSSSLIAVFTVDVTTDVRISLDVTASGDAVFDLSLRYLQGAALIDRQFWSTDTHYEETVTLEPGTYQIAAGGGGDAVVGQGHFSHSDLSAEFSTTFLTTSGVEGTEPVASPVRVVPNPVRGAATVLGVAPSSASTIELWNAAGRHVRTLNVVGGGETTWNLRDDAGRAVTPGVYFARAGAAPPTRIVVAR